MQDKKCGVKTQNSLLEFKNRWKREILESITVGRVKQQVLSKRR
jgi:hypothetical protein